MRLVIYDKFYLGLVQISQYPSLLLMEIIWHDVGMVLVIELTRDLIATARRYERKTSSSPVQISNH